MDLENRYFNYLEEDEENIILPPYWLVRYIDYKGYKHLATVKDEKYLSLLKENYEIIDVTDIKKDEN